MAYLAEVGAERDDSEQTKTRWALVHYAAKLAPALAAGARQAAVARTKASSKEVARAARSKKAAPAI